VVDRRPRLEKMPAVGKGIGRDVYDAHDERVVEPQPEPAASEKGMRIKC
jgi:hypothetical protein